VSSNSPRPRGARCGGLRFGLRPLRSFPAIGLLFRFGHLRRFRGFDPTDATNRDSGDDRRGKKRDGERQSELGGADERPGAPHPGAVAAPHESRRMPPGTECLRERPAGIAALAGSGEHAREKDSPLDGAGAQRDEVIERFLRAPGVTAPQAPASQLEIERAEAVRRILGARLGNEDLRRSVAGS